MVPDIDRIIFRIYKPYQIFHLLTMICKIGANLSELSDHSVYSIFDQFPVLLIVDGKFLFPFPPALLLLLPKIETNLFSAIAFQKNYAGPPAKAFIYGLLTQYIQGGHYRYFLFVSKTFFCIHLKPPNFRRGAFFYLLKYIW